MEPIYLDKVTARRYVMGKQGLWPGRRWSGLEGTGQALYACEALQLDPLNIVARSQEIALWGRVLDFQPAHLYHWLYQKREFFDFGGALFVYPMKELPYWRLHMQRAIQAPRWAHFAAEQPELLDEVRAELRARGPLGNRDFKERAKVSSYRARKDSGLAMYYLWLAGELMIHHREGFERFYDFREHIAPPEYDYAAPVDEAERYFVRKPLAFHSLLRDLDWRNYFSGFIHRKVEPAEWQGWRDDALAEGLAVPAKVEGRKDGYFVPGEDLPLLETLSSGGIPEAWQPLDGSTTKEVTFLAPLEIVSARGRAAWLLDFEYIWEVYKPVETRRWGYYVLPILYGDRLVARLDPRLDRKTSTLEISGFWLEADAPAKDPAFAQALANGLAQFRQFVGAARVTLDSLPEGLRAQVAAALEGGAGR